MNNEADQDIRSIPLEKVRVMKSRIVALLALPLALSLGACGESMVERVASGGGIGAGAGLAVGAIAGWPLVLPIIAGGVAGAAIGAATAPKQGD